MRERRVRFPPPVLDLRRFVGTSRNLPDRREALEAEGESLGRRGAGRGRATFGPSGTSHSPSAPPCPDQRLQPSKPESFGRLFEAGPIRLSEALGSGPTTRLGQSERSGSRSVGSPSQVRNGSHQR